MGLDELLLRQAGVLTRGQAVACGVSARTVARRVSEGQWRRLHTGVYLAAGHRLTDEARVVAAWLWGGGLVAGPAAAYWHGLLARPPAVIELAVPQARRPVPGVRLRERSVPPQDRVTVRGVAVTGLARTVLDTAVVLPDGAAFLDRALQRHLSFAEVGRAYSRMLGSAGSARARHLVTAAADRADSGAERHLMRILRGAGLTGWTRAHPFGAFTIDVAFVEARVAIEVDGWAWHSDVERFRTDRRKQNALVAAGWTVLRFTWHDLVNQPGRVAQEVRSALSRAA